MVRITEDLIRKRAEHNELMVRNTLGPASFTARPDLPEPELKQEKGSQKISDFSRNKIFRNHAILKLN